MAFRDSDGRITIDEIAADKDIKQLRLSIAKMETAVNQLKEIQIQTEEFSGNTGIRIRESAAELIKEITQSIQTTEETIERIQMAVAKYQQIDKDLKNNMNTGIRQG